MCLLLLFSIMSILLACYISILYSIIAIKKLIKIGSGNQIKTGHQYLP